MEAVWHWGIAFIVAVQHWRTPLLDLLFRAFNEMGEELFYLLLLPVIYWSIDARLGARVLVLFFVSLGLNVALKGWLHQPRPADFDPALQVVAAGGYGLPSGHAQSAAVVWGAVAEWSRLRLVRAGAIALAFFIGFSRIYLGVHFPTDVLGGWLLGAALVAASVWLAAPVRRVLAWRGTWGQVLAIFGVSLVVAVVAEEYHPAGGLAGSGTGLALAAGYLRWRADGPMWGRVVRAVLGAAVLLIVYFGLRVAFSGWGGRAEAAFQYLRYFAVGLWAGFGAPWVLQRLGLGSRARLGTTAE